MTAALRYVSTRGGCAPTGLGEAIGAGLAPDGGLFVPEAWPSPDLDAFARSRSLVDTATTLLAPFFAGDRLARELPAMCREAFDLPLPLRPLRDGRGQVLELFHGPTAAFKDFGARFLAACMARLPRTRPLTILVATSGDTGAAVAAAFHRRPGMRVVILYPDGRVSPRQAHQLGCFGDNVQALRVAGRFDDCQRMVKAALGDRTLQERVPLSSANSISLGRLLPQMSYYAHAALDWRRHHAGPLNLIVPTGNLGNALAALWVRRLGLPVGEVRLACNANAALRDHLAGARYRPREAVATLANAMDVGAPSNLERLHWTFPDLARLRRCTAATCVDDATIGRVIARQAREHDEIVCPHTATALAVLEELRTDGDSRPWTVVATAHPAKFEQVVEPLAGRAVTVPAALQAMLARPAAAEPIAAEPADLRDWLLAHAGAW